MIILTGNQGKFWRNSKLHVRREQSPSTQWTLSPVQERLTNKYKRVEASHRTAEWDRTNVGHIIFNGIANRSARAPDNLFVNGNW